MARKSMAHDQAREVEHSAKRRTAAAEAAVEKLPKDYRDAAFAVIDAGGLSLLEVQALEFAHHRKLDDMVQHFLGELAAGERVAGLVGTLVATQLQSRKHIRTIATAMNPGADALNVQPPISRDMLERYASDDDFGDDLVN